MRWLSFALLLAAASFDCSVAAAQEYPSRPIKLIVPWAPGGGIDNLARVVGEKLAENFGQSVVVENRPGAGSSIGTAFVGKAAPDGYTLILSNTTHAINATLYQNLPYDSIKDFAPVVLMANAMTVLVTYPSFPANSVKDLIALAKAKPGTVDYASAGNGSIQHLAGELFKTAANIDIVHIPFKAGGTVVADLISMRVAIYFPPVANILPMITSAKLKPIAVTGLQRSPLLPEVPTVSESGLPGFEVTDWYGIQAPAGTSPEIVAKLNTEINKIMNAPDMKERLRARGYEVVGGSPEQFGQLIHADIKKWGTIIKASGVRLD